MRTRHSKNPEGARQARARRREIGKTKSSSNLEEEGKEVKATMIRSLLLLALVASVVCSVNAAAQVGGSIRGSSTATESSSAASSALASAASTFLKVWPHPAAQVLHHATNAVRRKLVSYKCIWIFA